MTYVKDKVAFGTPLRDRRAGVRLEIEIDVPILPWLLDHTPDRLFVEGLASAAYIVYSSLAAMSALAEVASRKSGRHT